VENGAVVLFFALLLPVLLFVGARVRCIYMLFWEREAVGYFQ